MRYDHFTTIEHYTRFNETIYKGSDKDRVCFELSVLRMEKLMAGTLDGLQIRELMKGPHFQDPMNNAEADAWSLFTRTVMGFLVKADNYFEVGDSMLSPFRQLSSIISIKMHYIHNHFDRFPENVGDLN